MLHQSILRCGHAKGSLVSVSIAWIRATWNRCWKRWRRSDFPINPQIYHDAAMVYRYPDEHEETEADHAGGISGLCRTVWTRSAGRSRRMVSTRRHTGDQHAGGDSRGTSHRTGAGGSQVRRTVPVEAADRRSRVKGAAVHYAP